LNSVKSRTTGFSSFFLFFAREPVWTIDLLMGLPNTAARPYNEYPAEVMEKTEKVFETVRQNVSETGLKAQH
jgi:hypothetical protein